MTTNFQPCDIAETTAKDQGASSDAPDRPAPGFLSKLWTAYGDLFTGDYEIIERCEQSGRFPNDDEMKREYRRRKSWRNWLRFIIPLGTFASIDLEFGHNVAMPLLGACLLLIMGGTIVAMVVGSCGGSQSYD